MLLRWQNTHTHACVHPEERVSVCLSVLNKTQLESVMSVIAGLCVKKALIPKPSLTICTCCQCEGGLQQSEDYFILTKSQMSGCDFVVVLVFACARVSEKCDCHIWFRLLHYPAGKWLQPSSPWSFLLSSCVQKSAFRHFTQIGTYSKIEISS